jgi:glycosyltransferase involved in cell wall biosynthesis
MADRRTGPIRVLRLFSRLNVGGPSVHVLLLTAGLEGRGYRTKLLVGRESPGEGNMFHLAEELGVEPQVIGDLGREVRLLSDLRVLFALRRRIREFRPQVVHTHTAKAGFLGRIAARWSGVPVAMVHTFHGHVLRGYFGPLRSALYRWLERCLARVTDRLIAVSDSVADDLSALRVAPRERFTVVRLGLRLDPLTVDLPRGLLRSEAGFPPETRLVGIVGRLVPIKDVGSFLEAAAIALKSLPELRFSVIGHGPERSLLESQAASLGLSRGHVHFHGW